MADVTNFKIGENIYNIKDTTARNAASTAQSTAKQAESTASTAQSTANSAKTAASTAQSTADSAKTAASTAQSTADSAKTIAIGAYPVYITTSECIEFNSKPEV
jgi:multidrug resistance efflux pump